MNRPGVLDLPIHYSPKKALGMFTDTHISGARIKRGPEMVDQPGQIKTNSED